MITPLFLVKTPQYSEWTLFSIKDLEYARQIMRDNVEADGPEDNFRNSVTVPVFSLLHLY
jgi:hypothetical protein